MRKNKKLEQTLQNAEKASDYQLAGELLTANLHLVKKEMRKWMLLIITMKIAVHLRFH